MAKSPNEYIAISPKGKSEAFLKAFADYEDQIEEHRKMMNLLGAQLLAECISAGFTIPPGKSARVVASRFDGKPQIMLTDAAPTRRTF